MRIAVALLLMTACEGKITVSEPTNVDVDCTTVAEGVECVVKQTLGTSEAEACWDLTFTCANGAIVKPPHLCQKVKDGGTAKLLTPRDKLDGIDKCGGDKPPTGKLENLTINGKTPDKVTPH